MMSHIEIYQSADEQVQLQVSLNDETVWLNRQQLAVLFDRDIKTIGKHVNNVFTEGELDKSTVVANFATTAADGKSYQTEHYNLDVIISVGYRVKSARGTQFRQWATARLKEFLVQGYAINQKRLDELGQMVRLIEQSAQSDSVHGTQTKGLLDILSHYTKSFVLLNQFDSSSLTTEQLNENISYEIDYAQASAAIGELKCQLMAKNEATELFGNPKDDGFQSSLASVVQSFGGQYLYPSIEEQAAHLLYFVIKNHSFSDGNKRIGAFLFVWFLEQNKHRFKRSGELKINDNALVAIALLVAQSVSSDKELMIKLIVNLIKDEV